MTVLCSLIPSHVIPSLYDFICSVEHKICVLNVFFFLRTPFTFTVWTKTVLQNIFRCILQNPNHIGYCRFGTTFDIPLILMNFFLPFMASPFHEPPSPYITNYILYWGKKNMCHLTVEELVSCCSFLSSIPGEHLSPIRSLKVVRTKLASGWLRCPF